MSQDLSTDDPTLRSPYFLLFRGGGVPIVYWFPLAPQEARVIMPSRGQVHQTVDSNFLDEFSGPRSILARVLLRGTFGYHPRLGSTGQYAPGSAHLRFFQALYETYNSLSQQIKNNLGAVTEYLVPLSLTYWRVWVDRLEWQQSHRDPLLIYYTMSFVRLQDYLNPVAPSLPPNLVPAGAGSLLADLGSL